MCPPQATQHQAEFAPGQLLLPQSTSCPLSKLSPRPKQKHWMKLSAGTKAEASHNDNESMRDGASFYMCKTLCTHTSHKTSLEWDENSPNNSLGKLFCWFLTSLHGYFFFKFRSHHDLPQHNPISHSFEQVICIWVHWNNMSAVGIIFQGFVYPVYKGIFLFL